MSLPLLFLTDDDKGNFLGWTLLKAGTGLTIVGQGGERQHSSFYRHDLAGKPAVACRNALARSLTKFLKISC